MINLLSQLPSCVEELTIFLIVVKAPYIQLFSQDYDWHRLETLIYSFPNLKAADIILFANRERYPFEDTFTGVPNECQVFVESALSSGSHSKENIIRVSRQEGFYEDFIGSYKWS